MAAPRRQLIACTALGLAVVWLVAWGGYRLAQRSRVTAEKVTTYLQAVDLAALSGEERAKALRELERQMCALPVAERRRARLEGGWHRWFAAMTEGEKEAFIAATLPSGFKQMLEAFEKLPEEKRKRAIDDALKELKRAASEITADPGSLTPAGPRADADAPVVSDELQEKMVNIGLKSFYTQSSAQTKAEMAPVLEELQRLMESGRLFRGRP